MVAQTYFIHLLAVLEKTPQNKMSFLVASEKFLKFLRLEQRLINQSPWPDHNTNCPALSHELTSDSSG